MIDLNIINQTRYSTPNQQQFSQWIHACLSEKEAHITLAIVDHDQSKRLNHAYRHKLKPTNVLSFLYEASPLTGELIFCPSIIEQEAHEQQKKLADHWAHLTVHATLHLLGYDHEQEQDAKIMEAKEAEILGQFGIMIRN